jgi:ribosomal protein L33
MKTNNIKVVNEFYRQFVNSKTAKERFSVKKYASNHLELEDFCSFLGKTTDWLIRQIEALKN